MKYRICGIKVSEICRLKVEDIDSKDMRLFIRQAKCNKDCYPFMRNTLITVPKGRCRVMPEFAGNGRAGDKEYFPPICQINFWHIGRVYQRERKERLKYENQF